MDQKFLTTSEAAKITGYTAGYLAYLRTATAHEHGHVGPPYLRVDLRDGSANPIRIRYDAEALIEWVAARQAQRNQPPLIEHVAG